MKDWKDVKKKLLQDPEVRRGYDDLEVEYSIITQILQKRIEMGLTQKQLAERVGTKQSAIARLEAGNSNPTVAFLQKVASALDSQLRISL